MLEIGWSEMLVIAIVMIVVVQPKDLPGMLRSIGRTVAKLRSMAGDFQKQFNEALKEAELDDVKSSIDAIRGLNPKEQIRKHLNPFEQAAADVRSGLDNLHKSTPPKPAEPEAHPAEPLKTGPVEIPDMPAASAALNAAPPAMKAAEPAAAETKSKAKAAAKPKAPATKSAKSKKASA